MERQLINKTMRIDGMTCTGCEMRIESTLRKLPGLIEAQAKYSDGTVQVQYNPELLELLEIIEAIESLDYTVKSTRSRVEEIQKADSSDKKLDITGLLGIGVVLFALYFLVENTIGFNFIPEVNQNMGYAVLFVVGLLTSLHCIAMCGGINLSQCVSYKTSGDSKLSKLKPSILYNAGRVVSYTVIGGIVGAIGSVVSLSGSAKGLVSIIAGGFMIIMGLNMLNIFPWLRKLTPRMPKFFGNKIYNNKGNYGPFVVGLLNGFMPCGPLQTMQIYALGTGSAVSGALSMFLFSMGTVPLMFGFGAVSSLLSSKFTNKMMKVSALLVMGLGIVMLNRGFSLSGVDPLALVSSSVTGETTRSASSYQNAAVIKDGVQYITTEFTGRSYAPITVQKGIPVKWTIQITQNNINGCNNPIEIRKFGMEIKLVAGDNLVEFTPDESGTIPYSCWMGMIKSRIVVVDDLGDSSQAVSDSGSIADNFSGLPPEDNGISTDNIHVASVVNDVQDVTVTLSDKDFSPGVIVLQEGIEFILRFDVKTQLDESDPNASIIFFPEYGGGINLLEAPETPLLPSVGDFSFQDAYGTKRVFVKVVDDINNIDEASIVKDAQSYQVNLGGDSGNEGASCH